MTKDEQRRAIKNIETAWFAPGAYFEVDGYVVAAQMVPETPYRWRVAVYIDGMIMGKWMTENPQTPEEISEPPRRFWNVRFHPLWSRAILNKLSKRHAAELKKENKGFWSASPYFPSATAFVRRIDKAEYDKLRRDAQREAL